MTGVAEGFEDRLVGCILGGAVGDALGAPVEFSSLAGIRREYGPQGIGAYVDAYGGPGHWTDDTQMTLFTMEALLEMANDGADPDEAIWAAYKRWHAGQISGQEGAGLLAFPAMRSRRAPGSTCLSALSGEAMGTAELTYNDSKGCGGVMRVAPIGVLADPFDLACRAAAATHGHPTGWLAAGAMAVMVSRLLRGAERKDAVEVGLDSIVGRPNADETAVAVRGALVAAATGGPPTAETVERLGAGWIAEEALAIAVYAFLTAVDFESGIVLAANHSGDSDSTASMAGQLWGAHVGEGGIPTRWLDGLEMAEEIRHMAVDLAGAYDPGAPT